MGSLVASIKRLFAGREMELIIIGLENSGKSTLTSQISFGKPTNRGPTIGLDVRTFQKGNLKLKLWDLGGQGIFISSISFRMGKLCFRM